MIKERNLYHQVIGGTMKTRFIELIGIAIIQRLMRIDMMRHEGMDGDLGGDRQRKQGQESTCHERPYRPMNSHKSLKLCCKLR